MPKSLGGTFVSRGGGADVIVVGDEDALIETLEAGNVL